MDTHDDRDPSQRPGSFRPFRVIGSVATAIARTAGSAIALVEDAELRKKASELVVGQARGGFDTVRKGVATGADSIGQRIRSGPAQVQSVLSTLQKRIEEQRLLVALKEERDEPVDVQIGPQLYERAPQELRSRLWIALLDNGTLATSVENSALTRTGSEMSGSRPGSAVRHSSSWPGEDRPDALPEDVEEEQPGASAPQPQDADQQRHQAETDGAAEHPVDAMQSIGAAVAGHKSSQQVVKAATELQGTANAAPDPGSSERQPANVSASSPTEAGDATAGHAAAEMSGGSEKHSGAAAPDQVKDGEDASEPHSPARRDPYSFVRRVPTAADSPQSSPRTGGYGWARQQSRQGSPPQGVSDSRGQLSPRMAAARQAAELADHIVADAAAADAASGIAAEAAAAVAAAASAGVVLPDSRRQSSSSGGAAAGDDSGSDRQSPAQRAVQRLHESTARHAAALDQQRSSDNGTRSVLSDTSRPDDRNGHFTSSAASTHGIEVADGSDLPLVSAPPSRPSSVGQHSPAAHAPFDADFHGFARNSGEIDAWEMVQDGGVLYNFEGSTGLSARLHPAAQAKLSAEDAAIWQKLMVAIMTLPWPISTEYPEDCRYNTLLQISIGQEETDDIISRDINRTFPEHPQFGFEQGQQALFRVLKAYSLHDLEVNYCQGMAFVAGIILMYLPEEPAFRMLARLLDERGPNLRRLYLPGLEGLKQQLRALEWLMERHFPALAAHLQVNTVAPVLYASQWFLTLFACPFPSAFSARVIDIILAEGNSEILLQTALAVVAQCETELLQLDDFEDIITHLKVEPVRWSKERQRKVLHAAVSSVVTSEMIRAATFAVSTGYCGSLSRRTSSRADVASAAAAAAAVAHSRNRSFSGAAQPGAGVNANELSDALATVEHSQDSVAAKSELADATLDTDDLELVLAMDMLLDTPAQPGSSEASGRHGVQSSAVSAQMEPIAEHALTEQEGKDAAGAEEK